MGSLIPTKMKFLFECKENDGIKTFILTNATSKGVSNLCVDTFELVYLDNDRDNLLTNEVCFPSYLGPNSQCSFRMTHKCLNNRPGLAKAFELVFFVEDEKSNRYRCVACKNVEDPRKEYAIGDWVFQTERVGEC